MTPQEELHWPYRTSDIVRWHFNVADLLLLAGFALAGLLGVD
jgi:hypothetical protein